MSKIIYHPVIVIIFTIIGIVFFISLSKSAQKTDISSRNIEFLEKEVNDMSIETAKIEEKIIETDSDEFKEKVIRNELLLQKPGEKIIQMPTEGNIESAAAATITQEKKPIEEWWKLIFGDW